MSPEHMTSLILACCILPCLIPSSFAGTANKETPERHSLTGSVVDFSTGQGIAGARVIIEEEPWASTTTDNNGHFILHSLPGSIAATAVATHPDYQQTWYQTILTQGDTFTDLSLRALPLDIASQLSLDTQFTDQEDGCHIMATLRVSQDGDPSALIPLLGPLAPTNSGSKEKLLDNSSEEEVTILWQNLDPRPMPYTITAMDTHSKGNFPMANVHCKSGRFIDVGVMSQITPSVRQP